MGNMGLRNARKAFNANDIELSKRAHEQRVADLAKDAETK